MLVTWSIAIPQYEGDAWLNIMSVEQPSFPIEGLTIAQLQLGITALNDELWNLPSHGNEEQWALQTYLAVIKAALEVPSSVLVTKASADQGQGQTLALFRVMP